MQIALFLASQYVGVDVVTTFRSVRIRLEGTLAK